MPPDYDNATLTHPPFAQVFEAAMPYTLRFMIDMDINGCNWIVSVVCWLACDTCRLTPSTRDRSCRGGHTPCARPDELPSRVSWSSTWCTATSSVTSQQESGWRWPLSASCRSISSAVGGPDTFPRCVVSMASGSEVDCRSGHVRHSCTSIPIAFARPNTTRSSKSPTLCKPATRSSCETFSSCVHAWCVPGLSNSCSYTLPTFIQLAVIIIVKHTLMPTLARTRVTLALSRMNCKSYVIWAYIDPSS